mgnify:CR=1 FL=1
MYQDTYCQTQISIHVPREGDDYLRKLLDGDSRLISIHVPREGDDSSGFVKNFFSQLFQSTSPVRGTTAPKRIRFYSAGISIHVPREGDDAAVAN